MLLKQFKSAYSKQLWDLAYKQWLHLGVGLFPGAETDTCHVIDLEALITFTLMAATEERRLFEAVLEWILENRSMINASRLKRMATLFEEYGKPPHIHSVRTLLDWVRKDTEEQLLLHIATLPGMEKFHKRKILSDVNIQDPWLLQLKLRAMFGVNARSEIFLFLLQHGPANSNAMAREIGFAQKQVYLILENWTEAGILHRIRKGRAGNYSLQKKDHWLSLLNMTGMPETINWIQMFGLLVQIFLILKETDDTYLIASRFRDIAPKADAILSSNLGKHLPDPSRYQGEIYFAPFADTILAALHQLY